MSWGGRRPTITGGLGGGAPQLDKSSNWVTYNTFAEACIERIRNISFIIALDGHYGGGEHLFINIDSMGQYLTMLVHCQ